MKLRSIALAALAVLACALVNTTAAEAGTAKKKCSLPKGAKLLRKAPQVVVYSIDRSSGDVTGTLYGCYRPNGKRYRLADSTDDGLGTLTVEFSKVKTNSRFVAWQWTSTDISCKADCPPDYEPTTYSIERVDLKNGKTLEWPSGQVAFSSLVVSRAGNVAWTEPAGPENVFTLKIGNKSGSKVIDTGDGGLVGIRLVGTTLSWTNAGESKSTTLR
jgi:hypothetical protein